ncbi:MAG: hypothetical protein HW388_1670 [Dehalococcoidia bacterium]|nr:hypothetical protein [Dehalococcoidia bacterium]
MEIMKKLASILRRGQDGFTLIELLAVMSILAVLVAVVAPSVTGTRDASINAQVMQDATQVRGASTKYYASINTSEVRTPHTVTTQTQVNGAALTSSEQVTSSKWPEKFITVAQGTLPAGVTAIGSVYSDVFETKTAGIKVDKVVLLDEEGNSITAPGTNFLPKFTAIDMAELKRAKLLEKEPAGSELESDGAPNFLWLFEKTSSTADAVNADDSREVAVFKLVKVEIMETADTDGGSLELTYRRIF